MIELKPVTTLNGEPTWCGPSIISSITGEPVASIVRVIKDQRISQGCGHFDRFNWDTGLPSKVERVVQGTHTHEIKNCLKHYGYDIIPTEINIPLTVKGNKPTITQWLKQRKDRNECNLVNAGYHWQLIKGVMFVDSYTKIPVFTTVAPHQRKRVARVHKVIRI